MVLTPLHVGPGILLGLVFYRYLDIPGLVLGSIIVDFRAIAVVFGLVNGPVHGAFHSFLGATLLGFLGAASIIPFRSKLEEPMEMVFLEQPISKTRIVAGTVIGTWTAIGIDSILYTDVSPLIPLSGNPLYGTFSQPSVYIIVLSSFFLSLIIYLYRVYQQIE